jgi:hypothetical protein
MEKLLWISYDLGVKGDYENLYAWLDNHNAKECGDSVAVLTYNFQDDLIKELKDDLQNNISSMKRDRIYIIWRERSKIRGRFLFGARKAPPWTGYGSRGPAEDEET